MRMISGLDQSGRTRLSKSWLQKFVAPLSAERRGGSLRKAETPRPGKMAKTRIPETGGRRAAVQSSKTGAKEVEAVGRPQKVRGPKEAGQCVGPPAGEAEARRGAQKRGRAEPSGAVENLGLAAKRRKNSQFPVKMGNGIHDQEATAWVSPVRIKEEEEEAAVSTARIKVIFVPKMPKTDAERQKAYRDRKKNDAAFKEKEKMRKQAERLRKKLTQSEDEEERVRKLARDRQRQCRLRKKKLKQKLNKAPKKPHKKTHKKTPKRTPKESQKKTPPKKHKESPIKSTKKNC
ncbi:ensconsin [Amia ocellicauda]|uniref:ensconsin n=1 Tax=Amia ocellicauda TaxID=2972642 RepID=UPI00346484A6